MPTIYTNNAAGTLSADPGLSGTTVSSSGFAVLPVIAAPDTMWLVLDPDGSAGVPEICQITAHSSGATSVTVLRGQQSSTARTHAVGTDWTVPVTKADLDELPFRKVTAKGDLLAGTGANAVGRKAVGTDGLPLVARSSDSTGIAYEQLASGAIADSVVTSAKIADGAVSTAKLADGSVTQAKIASGAVGTSQLQDGQIISTKLADGAIVNAKIFDNAVGGSKIADGSVTLAKASAEVWRTWTPTLSNFTLGNGSVTARYWQHGKTVTVKVKVTLGSTSSMGTAPTVSLPVAALSTDPPGALVTMQDASAGVWYGALYYSTASAVGVFPFNVVGGAAQVSTAGTVSATVPFTWTTADYFTFTFTYEAA